jgi:hypothetical protein
MELTAPEDPMAAVLDMLAAHAERLAQIDAQSADAADQARRLTQRIDVLGLRLDQAVLARQDGDKEPPYAPAPTRRWWKLAGRERDNLVVPLRAWVSQIYRPGYGKLAAALGPCWDQHTACLYILDILTELWTALYLPDQRAPGLLSAQAEFQARILPALATQLATETARCPHHPARPASGSYRLPPPGTEPEATQ